MQLNINNMMKKIKNILNIWQPRCLAIKGRITVIKSLIIPHILQTASIVPFGESLWNETIYDVVKTAKIMLREFVMILKLLGKYWHNI